jgi:hypothetical protein
VADKILFDVRRAGAFGKRHFKVDMVRLTGKICGMQEAGLLDRVKPAYPFVGNRQTITETTPEITTDISKAGLNKLESIKEGKPIKTL